MDFKKLGCKKTLIIGISLVVLMALVVIITVAIKKESDQNEITTISTATLKEVVEISELSTVEYTYNAIAKKVSKDKKGIDFVEYYVAYEGIISAGIEFDKISFGVNNETKEITILIPEVKTNNINIDMGSLEYIFTDEKYETETVTHEAYTLCLKDLENRLINDAAWKQSAIDNAISEIEALYRPWLETMNEEFDITIKQEEKQ